MASTQIYLVTNIDSNPYKIYIGKSKDFKSRQYAHRLRFGNQIEISIIDEVDSLERQDWKFLECHWIEQFRQWGYTLTNKNRGGGGKDYHDAASRQLLSSIKQGRKNGPYKKRKDVGVSKGPFSKQICQHCSKLVGKNNIRMHELQCKCNPEKVFISNRKNSERYKGIKRNPYKKGIKKPNVGIALRGRKRPLTKCPHCGKQGGSNMNRYHFDNCKQK